MDFSIVAAVGSFMVSERVLRPKSLLIGVFCALFVYDLTTKTHDAASLRVYRGPGLLAFTLLCCAYSLRTWRRNGVACDELIFLPGTLHGEKHSATPTLDHFVKRGISNISNASNDSEKEMDVEMAPMIKLEAPETDVRPLSSPEEEEEDVVILEESSDESSEEHPLTFCPDHASIFQRGIDLDSDAIPPSTVESWEDAEEDGHYAYSPSGPTVFGAALDLFFPVLLNFHLFTAASNRDMGEGDLNPKILPLIFLSILCVRAVIPPARRRRFWGTLRYTFMAPLYPISFRDDFIGDILTSFARPAQDLAFALFYYAAVVQGLATSSYGLTETDAYLEKSWWLHNLVLPFFAIAPLWWRFMQMLRLTYDTRKRLPHLANAFKYLSAAVVILYAMTHSVRRSGTWWYIAFVVCVFYQIYWDVVVDWELFVIRTPPQSPREPFEVSDMYAISSLEPTSCCASIYRLVLRPLLNFRWSFTYRIKKFSEQIHLRPKRLFKRDAFYWSIFWFNCCTRFCWMLSFVPARHITPTGEVVQTFSADVNGYIGVITTVSEIVRRCLWSILRVELESIKLTDPTYTSDRSSTQKWSFVLLNGKEEEDLEEEEAVPIIDAKDGEEQISPDSLDGKLLFIELSLWTIAFLFLGVRAITS